MRFGRRPTFFAFVAVVSFILTPANLPEFRWVNYFAGALAALWAVLLWIELLAGRGPGERGAGL